MVLVVVALTRLQDGEKGKGGKGKREAEPEQ